VRASRNPHVLECPAMKKAVAAVLFAAGILQAPTSAKAAAGEQPAELVTTQHQLQIYSAF